MGICASSKLVFTLDSEEGMNLEIKKLEEKFADESVPNDSISETESLMAKVLALEEQAKESRASKSDRETLADWHRRVTALLLQKYPDLIPATKEPVVENHCETCSCNDPAPTE